MKKNPMIIVLPVLAAIMIITFLILIQNLSIPPLNEIPLKPQARVYATYHDICSTPTFILPCKEGLICATNKNISDFNPNIKTGRCEKSENIIDINSTTWKRKFTNKI